VTFILAATLLIIVRVLSDSNTIFGLFERLLVLNMIIWVEVAAVRLFFLSLKRKAQAASTS
jgi:hypothetical protein